MVNLHPPIFILILALVVGTLLSSSLNQGRKKFPGPLLETLFQFSLLFNLTLILRLVQYYTAGNIWPNPPDKSIFFTMFMVEYLSLSLYLIQLRLIFLLLKPGRSRRGKSGIVGMSLLMGIPLGLSCLAMGAVVQRIMLFMHALPYVYLSGLLWGFIVFWKGRSSRHEHGQDGLTEAFRTKLSLFFILYFVSLTILRFCMIFKELNHSFLFLLLPVHFFVFGILLFVLGLLEIRRLNLQSPSGRLSQEIISRFCQCYQISTKEKDVLMQICSGKSNQEIAEQLDITINTVKFHITHIYQKTDVKNRVQLLNLMVNHRL